MRDDDNKRMKGVILALVMIVVILLGFIAYFFWMQPAYQNFVFSKQQEAYNQGIMDSQRALLNGIMENLNNLGYVQIVFENNQTVVLVPVQPSQQGQEASLVDSL